MPGETKTAPHDVKACAFHHCPDCAAVLSARVADITPADAAHDGTRPSIERAQDVLKEFATRYDAAWFALSRAGAGRDDAERCDDEAKKARAFARMCTTRAAAFRAYWGA